MSTPTMTSTLMKIFRKITTCSQTAAACGDDDPTTPLRGLVACSAIALYDDEDLTQWDVRLLYPPKIPSEADDEVVISVRIKVQFREGRFPLCFIVAPRVIAPNIHHGVLCYEKMGTTSWTLDLPSVCALLLALRLEISPENLDASSEHYTSREHEMGVAHIGKHHPTWLDTSRPRTGWHQQPPPPTLTRNEASPPISVTCHDEEGLLKCLQDAARSLSDIIIDLQSPIELLSSGEEIRQPITALAALTLRGHSVDVGKAPLTVVCGTVTLSDCHVKRVSDDEGPALTVSGPAAHVILYNVRVEGGVSVDNGGTLLAFDCVFETTAKSPGTPTLLHIINPGSKVCITNGKIISHGMFHHTLAVGHGASATLDHVVVLSAASNVCLSVDHAHLIVRSSEVYTMSGAIAVSPEVASCEVADTIFDYQGAGEAIGISLASGAQGTISTTKLRKYHWGVFASGSSQLSMLRCTITQSFGGVCIKERKTEALLRNCSVESRQCAVLVAGLASAELMDDGPRGLRQYVSGVMGLEVQGAKVTCRGISATGGTPDERGYAHTVKLTGEGTAFKAVGCELVCMGKWHSLFMERTANATLTDCSLRMGTTGPGVFVAGEGTDLTLHHCTVTPRQQELCHNVESKGIVVQSKAKATVKDTTIDHIGMGLSVEVQGSALLEKCVVRGSSHGVIVVSAATCVIQDCVVCGLESVGVGVWDGATCTVSATTNGSCVGSRGRSVLAVNAVVRLDGVRVEGPKRLTVEGQGEIDVVREPQDEN